MPPSANFLQLCERLRDLRPNAVVGIEGFMNSGKSCLSNTLIASLACKVIHIDDFVSPGDASLPYVERLNYDQLKLSLHDAVISSSLVFAEGICLRHVLARLEVSPELFIYVKRIAASGLWHDGLHLEEYEANKQSVGVEPEKSDMHYHSLERPHERAEIVLHRPES